MYQTTETPPPAYLTMELEDGNTQRFELGPFNSLGRHPRNSIQIMDRLISKEHARVIFQNGTYYVQDLGSRNGTFVNEEPVSECALKPGDELRLGTVPLNFFLGPAVQPHMQTVTSSPVSIMMDEAMHSARIAQITHDVEVKDFLPETKIKDEKSLRKDYEKLRIAQILTRKIGQELNLDKLLHLVLEETFNLVRADRGVIFFLDDEGNPELRCVRFRDSRDESKEEISISRAILNSVIEDRSAVLTSDAKIDERFEGSQSVIMQGIRSAMVVPFISLTDGSIIGVMHLDTQSAIGMFTEKDLQILSVVAAQSTIAIENARLTQTIEKETVIRGHLQRFLSPAVMDRLTKDDLEIRMGGEIAEVTVMFTDIRGFTSLSEQYEPNQLIKELNTYFEKMVDVIFNYEGTLDKYIGDAIMAVWGTPQTHPHDPLRAVQAAVEMQTALYALNQRREAEGKPPFLTGIGVNTGIVTAGNMGSPKRLEFTVIGDNVNVASRLCGLAAGGEVIISQDTYDHVKDFFICHELPPAKVKGKAEMVKTYRVDGYADDLQDEDGFTLGNNQEP